MRVIELCSGVGGLRAGLELAGAETVFSCDNDAWAVAAQNGSFGSAAVQAKVADVSDLDGRSLPECDVIAAGFPCQPFSSSGNRRGFAHLSGNVFEHVLRIALERGRPELLLENVQGLLSNQGGYTFAICLQRLLDAGYDVQWHVINALDLGVPQNRPRLIIQASQGGVPAPDPESGSGWTTHLLEDLVERLEPRVGSRPEPVAFGSMGVASAASRRVQFARSTSTSADLSVEQALSSLVYGRSQGSLAPPSSVRFWGHSGTTRPYFRYGSSHCIGTNIGAAPLFAVPEVLRRAVSVEYNWSRVQEGWFIFRLTPVAALPLFGVEASMFAAGLSPVKSQVRGYRLLGNMVAPRVAQALVNLSSPQVWSAAS